jgi:hypothetical protein
MLLPGGGLNARIALIAGSNPFPANAINEFKAGYRCITADSSQRARRPVFAPDRELLA